MNLFKGSFRLKKNTNNANVNVNVQHIKISLWKASVLALTEGILFLLVLAYFVLKGEGVILSSSIFGWLAAFAVVGVVILHSQNKKIRIRFDKNSDGQRSLVAYKEIIKKQV